MSMNGTSLCNMAVMLLPGIWVAPGLQSGSLAVELAVFLDQVRHLPKTSFVRLRNPEASHQCARPWERLDAMWQCLRQARRA
jgi:hypothetical protein